MLTLLRGLQEVRNHETKESPNAGGGPRCQLHTWKPRPNATYHLLEANVVYHSEEDDVYN